MNGYICFYRGKRFEVYAETTFKAQEKCAKENKLKHRHEITVMLAEKNGEQITHKPMM